MNYARVNQMEKVRWSRGGSCFVLCKRESRRLEERASSDGKHCFRSLARSDSLAEARPNRPTTEPRPKTEPRRRETSAIIDMSPNKGASSLLLTRCLTIQGMRPQTKRDLQAVPSTLPKSFPSRKRSKYIAPNRSM